MSIKRILDLFYLWSLCLYYDFGMFSFIVTALRVEKVGKFSPFREGGKWSESINLWFCRSRGLRVFCSFFASFSCLPYNLTISQSERNFRGPAIECLKAILPFANFTFLLTIKYFRHSRNWLRENEKFISSMTFWSLHKLWETLHIDSRRSRIHSTHTWTQNDTENVF